MLVPKRNLLEDLSDRELLHVLHVLAHRLHNPGRFVVPTPMSIVRSHASEVDGATDAVRKQPRLYLREIKGRGGGCGLSTEARQRTETYVER
jgi:hypothetical protein